MKTALLLIASALPAAAHTGHGALNHEAYAIAALAVVAAIIAFARA